MQKHETDIHLEKAFVHMPSELRMEIECTFKRGEKEVQRKRKTWHISVAAAACLFFAAAVLGVCEFNSPKPDNVVLAGKTGNQNLPVPYTGDQAKVIPDKNKTTQDEAHFDMGDYGGEAALYTLLDNAYWAYTGENKIERDSRAVYAAVEALKQIPENYPDDKSKWMAPVRETLRNALGFSEDFIALHYLGNDVIICLRGMNEEVQKYFEPEYSPVENAKRYGYSMDYADPHTLYRILSLAHMEFVDENGLEADSNKVVDAARYFRSELFLNSYEKFNWPQLIRDRLMEHLGFTEEFIKTHFMIQDIIACMQATRADAQK